MPDLLEQVKHILADSLQIGDRVQTFDRATPLLGSLPELDSMAVVTLLTAVEEHFGFVIDDDEITADTFKTVGTLTTFIEQKLQI